jgi:hypothetical protein
LFHEKRRKVISLTIQHQYQNSPENPSIIERRPPELALWDLPYKGLHRHTERDQLRAELNVLKINYQHALDKVAELSKETNQLKNALDELEWISNGPP